MPKELDLQKNYYLKLMLARELQPTINHLPLETRSLEEAIVFLYEACYGINAMQMKDHFKELGNCLEAKQLFTART